MRKCLVATAAAMTVLAAASVGRASPTATYRWSVPKAQARAMATVRWHDPSDQSAVEEMQRRIQTVQQNIAQLQAQDPNHPLLKQLVPLLDSLQRQLAALQALQQEGHPLDWAGCTGLGRRTPTGFFRFRCTVDVSEGAKPVEVRDSHYGDYHCKYPPDPKAALPACRPWKVGVIEMQTTGNKSFAYRWVAPPV